jgi:hypothetical protein
MLFAASGSDRSGASLPRAPCAHYNEPRRAPFMPADRARVRREQKGEGWRGS